MKLHLLLAGLASACLTLSAHAAVQGRYDFNYQVVNAAGVGVVRAFDDGKNTVLAFSNLAGTSPSFTTPQGTPISYRAVDNYAVLSGVEHNVLIIVRGVTGHLLYGADASTPVTPVAVATTPLPRPAPVPATPPAPQAPVVANQPVAKSLPTPIPVAATNKAAVVSNTSTPAAKEGRPVASPASTYAAHDVPSTSQAPVPSVITPIAPSTWTIRDGQTLRQAVEQWALKASYKVVWQPDFSFDIQANASFSGDFITAVTTLFDSYRQASKPLFVDIYPSQHLVVVSASAEKVTK